MELYELLMEAGTSLPPVDSEELEDEIFHGPATMTPCTILLF